MDKSKLKWVKKLNDEDRKWYEDQGLLKDKTLYYRDKNKKWQRLYVPAGFTADAPVGVSLSPVMYKPL